jgi:phosphonate transport system substrate-binding protein
MYFCLTITAPRLALLLIALQSFAGVAIAEQRTYTVGVVPQFEPSKITKTWEPILKRISESSGIKLQLSASPSIPEFERQFEAGSFDFAYMNPYHLIVANEKQGYLPLIRDINSSLFGIIVVRKESPLKSVEGLDGKTVAFPAPNALGAALLTRAEFSRKFQIKIKEKYVNSHSSVYLNVLLGQVDAGGGVLKTLSQQPEDVRSQLRVLYKTTEIPSHPFVAHPSIS